MYREQIDAYIDGRKDEMLKDLCELVRIDSQKGQAQEGKPFGEGAARALEAAGKMMERFGLRVTDHDGYVVTGDLGEGERKLDILAHLDVVPVTSDWKVTQPFAPRIVDGRIYGRGTADDKGPAIAALYAARAVKELHIPLSYGLRIILGADEECGSADLKYYYEREKEAPCTFTPDADFPLIHLEKAQLSKRFSRRFTHRAYPGVTGLQAGDKVNVVPQTARAVVRGLDPETVQKAQEEAQRQTGAVFACSQDNEELTICAQGVAAHASTPRSGNNALTALLALLARLPLGEGDSTDAVRRLARMFPHGDTEGRALGIAMEDEESGELTMNLGILRLDEQGLEGQYDIRCPLCGNDKNVTEVLAERFRREKMAMEEGGMNPVHYIPKDSPLVQTLLSSYERYFGKKGEPIAIGGGTYVHGLERGVAFGCAVPEVDNHMHGDDEFMEIEMLLRSAKIFADAIVKICG